MGGSRNTEEVGRAAASATAVIGAVLGLFWLLAPAAVFAQSRNESDPEQEAIELVRQAIPLQADGRHEQALVFLEKAAGLSSHPKVLFLKARSQFALKRYEDALLSYRMIPQQTDQLDKDLVEEVRTNLAICEQMLAETLVHFVTPGAQAAAVTVDGEAIGLSPISKKLRRGTYQIRAAKEGFEPADKVIGVRGESQMTISLAMEPVQAEPVPVAPRSRESHGISSRTWGWIALGTGVASLAGSALFLVNYADKTSADLDSNQHVEGEQIDLGAGIGLGVLGVGLGVASAFLFSTEDEQGANAGMSFSPTSGGLFAAFTWRAW